MHILLFFLWCLSAFAQEVKTEHVTASLVAESSGVAPGGKLWLGLRLDMIPHWHTYWRFPGDSGLPTKVIWQLPPGWKISDPAWPNPERFLLPPLVNFGFTGRALIGYELEVPAGESLGAKEIRAKASWLVCREECVPEKVDLTYTVEVTPSPKAGDEAAAFAKLRKQQPIPLPEGSAIEVREAGEKLEVRFSGKTDWLEEELDFFPADGKMVSGKSPPRLIFVGGREVLVLEKAEPFQGSAGLNGILVVGDKTYSIAEKQAAAAPAITAATGVAPSFWLSLLLAFVSGLILNLMPCVFPVLGIKVMGLLEQSGGNAWRARLHGKVYAAGVVVSFWVLTGLLLVLREAGESVGWGFQLQHPGFVISLILLFFLIAGNLGGLFEFGGRWMGFGSSWSARDGWMGSFFTGVLAVVVATPCTAPFMGSAIGLVLTAPKLEVLAVFTALALGLAFPFVFLAYCPGFLAKLPRPGNWMVRVKEFFAFPILATVLWLLWVLGQQLGIDAVISVSLSLLLLAMALWVAKYFRGVGAMAAITLCLLGAAAGAFLPLRAGAEARRENAAGWQKFSEETLATARKEKKPVFVDFTAAWCLTCQVNKKLVLQRSALHEYFREKGVVLLIADWTNYDPAITQALARYGRIGVPLYLAFPAGGGEAVVLPQILTENKIREIFQ